MQAIKPLDFSFQGQKMMAQMVLALTLFAVLSMEVVNGCPNVDRNVQQGIYANQIYHSIYGIRLYIYQFISVFVCYSFSECQLNAHRPTN